jgi:hypothetical protein
MAVTLTEYNNLRRLVAIGRNELWYEDLDMAAGTMVELAAANGDIDTTDQLNMFNAFQSAFIVNGANLKVADFGNTKLTHSALGTQHAFGDLLTQDQGGGDVAYMVIKFTNTAKTLTYGYAYYAGDAEAFDTSTAVTGSGDGSGFTPSDVADPPHWYDWTPYAGGASGSMPNRAYLGCLYNGRCVLSGDPEHPEQWYMTRQANPFDFAYIANDPGSPVYGGASDLGELGDIVRCLAPYKDDYLVFGCASSVWAMFGDPMAGGAIREVSLTTGIFGANSYCWDNSNNFYFWGNNGLYRTTIPGVPQCISQFKLPRLIKNEAASPLTHRVTLLYDNDRHGVLVAITVLATGANSNYFYDLNALDDNEVGGFFPETYPTECGIYSGVYYDSNDPTLKGLVLGGTNGYIRNFDEATKNDVAFSGSEIAISSQVSLAPVHMSDVSQREGTIAGLDLTVAGGLPDGSQADSDDVDFKVFTARTSAAILEKMNAGTSPNFAGTFVGPGNLRGSTRRQTARGVYLGVKLENTTAGESWGFEELSVYLKDSGRRK